MAFHGICQSENQQAVSRSAESTRFAALSPAGLHIVPGDHRGPAPMKSKGIAKCKLKIEKYGKPPPPHFYSIHPHENKKGRGFSSSRPLPVLSAACLFLPAAARRLHPDSIGTFESVGLNHAGNDKLDVAIPVLEVFYYGLPVELYH